MIAAWMLYTTSVAAILGLAAWAAERALAAYRFPVRYVWIVALAGALAVPLVARLSPPGADTAAKAGAPVLLPGVWAGPSKALDRMGAFAAPLDTVLLIAWGLTSLVMLATLGVSGRRLARERRRWAPGAVNGRVVLVAPDLGPALIGLAPGAIVVPRWFLDLPAETRRLGLLHEQEHLEAGDTRVLAIGTGIVTLMPWNPALWWQLRRLRAAIELDCDRRVLGRGVNPSLYVSALLEVGERSRPALNYRPALAEPKSLLSRRVGTMFAKRLKNAWLRAGVYGVVVLLLLAVACEAPAPVERDVTGLASGPVDLSQVFVEAAVDQPPERISFPAPEYPHLLLQAGVEGQVTLEAIIDTEGRAEPNSIKVVNSTNRAFEAPARDAMRRALFRPGRVRGRPVRVLVQMPLRFSVGSRPVDARFVR